MRTALLTILLTLLASACATPIEPLSTTEAALASSNCSFIPGCRHLEEAADGRFSGSVMEYVDAAGSVQTRLAVSYEEVPSAFSFVPCQAPVSEQKVTLLFVTGPTNARVVLTRPMAITCPSQWGDNGGHPNRASFSVAKDEDPALWDALFPVRPDGSRWYALQVAASNSRGAWESRYGQNYALVMHPR